MDVESADTVEAIQPLEGGVPSNGEGGSIVNRVKIPLGKRYYYVDFECYDSCRPCSSHPFSFC